MIKQARTSAVIAAIIAILLTGCGGSMDNPYNSTPEEIADAQAKMRTWPSIEDTEQQMMTIRSNRSRTRPQLTFPSCGGSGWASAAKAVAPIRTPIPAECQYSPRT